LEIEEVEKGLSSVYQEKISPLSPLGQGGREKPTTEEVKVKADEEEETGSEEDEVSKEEHSGLALALVDTPKENGSKQDEVKEDESSDEEVYDEATEGAFEKLVLDALDKAKQGRSPLSKEDMAVVVEWLAWYRSSPVKMEPSVLDSPVSEFTPKDLMVSDLAFSLTSEGFPENRENEEGSSKVGEDSKRNSPLPGTGESAKSKGIGEVAGVVDKGDRGVSFKVHLLDSPSPLNRLCHGVDVLEGPTDLGHKEKQVEDAGQRNYGALHLLDKMPKSSYPEEKEQVATVGVVNKLLDFQGSKDPSLKISATNGLDGKISSPEAIADLGKVPISWANVVSN
ncbi:hypothetical protein U1Q18_025615, partial [Sarracenia purpurea var. burkii]